MGPFSDPERGSPPSVLCGETSDILRVPSTHSLGGSTTNTGSEDPSVSEAHSERRDFDDGANALWSLYGKEAQAHDGACIQTIGKDMDGILLFAGLFSAVVASFLVPAIQNLQVDPAKQSVYYQQQSVYYQQQAAYFQEQSTAILAQISQQLASITPEISTMSSIPPTAQKVLIPPSTPPPYYAFKSSSSDIRVSTYWLAGLICSLLAALLAMLIRHWVRSYMQVFQQYDHPLKRARFRHVFFEGSNRMRNLANVVPRLIQVSLCLFLLGLGDYMLHTNTPVGITTIIFICVGGLFYLYSILAHLKNMRSPYYLIISHPLLFIKQNIMYPHLSDFHGESCPVETYHVMEETDERKVRDKHAIRWLIDSTAAKANIEPLALAIPGSLNTEWGREVWTDISQECPIPSSLTLHNPRYINGNGADVICRSMRHLFETCNDHTYFQNEGARRRRMRVCVEATASLVCCVDFHPDNFGEVGNLIGDIGRIEKVNQPPTTASDQLFITRWTFLSLVYIQPILRKGQLKALAAYAVSGLTRMRSDVGQPDETALKSAQSIDERLRAAWEHVEELRQAFKPCEREKTRAQFDDILQKHIPQLERIMETDTVGLEDVDWRTSLYQNAMEDATHRITRYLPGVSFDELQQSEPVVRSSTCDVLGKATPQLIFAGQHLQGLARLSTRLREESERTYSKGYPEVVEVLKNAGKAPLSLRRPNGPMKQQLWRLQDLRDAGGLGFTIELFFLSLKHILTIPSLHESSKVFYVGAFKAITSHWTEGTESIGTHRILLDIICDLIIEGRGIFSDYVYPESITSMLLNMVGNMLQGYTGPDGHIRDALQEIEDVDFRMCTDVGLRRRALAAFS